MQIDLKKKVFFCGSGIKSVSHLTYETISVIKKSDMVLYLLNEPLISEWIVNNSKISIDLSKIYFSHELRSDSYDAISEYILEQSNMYEMTTVIFYGNPFFCAYSGLDAYNKILKQNSHEVYTFSSISSFDCLYMDIGFDPVVSGVQLYESGRFIKTVEKVNVNAYLILTQISFIDQIDHSVKANTIGLERLYKRLLSFYNNNHEVILYSGSLYFNSKALIQRISLEDLPKSKPNRITTLCIPPLKDIE